MKKIFDEINDLRQVINDIDDEKYKNVLSTINNVVNDMALKIEEIIVKQEAIEENMEYIVERKAIENNSSIPCPFCNKNAK